MFTTRRAGEPGEHGVQPRGGEARGRGHRRGVRGGAVRV